MKVHEGSDIRNVALIGHGHAGKTSLACALFYSAGATERLTLPDDGTAVTDFDEEEIYRKISISSSLAAFEWQKTKINLIDTPGYNIFLEDTHSSMVAADQPCWCSMAWRAWRFPQKRYGRLPGSSKCLAPCS